MKIIPLTLAVIIFISCKNAESPKIITKAPDEIIIEGDVKEIPDGKVYLTNAYYWMVNLDSTTVKDGKFVFRIKPDSNFYPYLASIYFPDSNSVFKKTSLMFKNNKSSSFYLEAGTTSITSSGEKLERYPSGGLPISVNVKAGRQNVAFINNLMSDFGWMGNIDSVKRAGRLRYFKVQIGKFPYSYFLLESIYNARSQYSVEEWNSLLSLFDRDVQISALGRKVKTYLANRRDPGSPYPNLSFINLQGKSVNIIDSNSQLNMLVFWASWCGPCRAEIPALKNLYANYHGKPVNVVSISVDEDEKEWRKAVMKEKMSWEQLIVGKDAKDFVETQFNFAAIPLIIFTDAEGKPVARFSGYEKGQEKKYDSIITQHLKSKL